jgi:hypothetical protein
MDQISDRRAGRELDAEVAGVMGLEDAPFSTDIDAAWQVVEKLGERGLYVSVSKAPDMENWDVRGWNVRDNNNRFIAHAATAPLAICVAALNAACRP